MEFWGVEVKAGEPLKVQPEFGKLIHVSQASLCEVKNPKEAKNVPLRLKVDSRDFIIGSLDAEDRTQLMFDLVFEKEFELSHGLKNGSVFFMGYAANDPDGDGGISSSDDSLDEPIDAKPQNLKVAKSSGAMKAGDIDGKLDSDDDEDSDSDEDLKALQGDSSGDEDFDEIEGDSSDEELPETQKSNKRPAPSAKETPVAAKKAKSATADKTDEKNGTATPIPSKAGGKTPKSGAGAQISCKSCTKTFTSEKALESHTKAKHGGK